MSKYMQLALGLKCGRLTPTLTLPAFLLWPCRSVQNQLCLYLRLGTHRSVIVDLINLILFQWSSMVLLPFLWRLSLWVLFSRSLTTCWKSVLMLTNSLWYFSDPWPLELRISVNNNLRLKANFLVFILTNMLYFIFVKESGTTFSKASPKSLLSLT